MCLSIGLGAIILAGVTATAQTAGTGDASLQPPPEVQAPAKLPYGVDDVLKLSRAHVSEDIIVNYIQNTGTIYNLNPQDLVYLRDQGVSDRVVNAMLDERKKLIAEASTQAPYAPQPMTQAPPPDTSTPPDDASMAPDTGAQQPSSSLYVIPYPQATAAYYGYYSSPYAYPSYYWPSVTFGFGYGGYYGGHYGYCYSGHGHWGGGSHWSGGGAHWSGGGHVAVSHGGGGHFGGGHR